MHIFRLSLHFTLVLSAHCADSYADIDAHNMGNIHDENRMFARMHSGRYFFFVHLHNCQIIHAFIITQNKNSITPFVFAYMYYGLPYKICNVHLLLLAKNHRETGILVAQLNLLKMVELE